MNKLLFESTLKILASGNFKEASTCEMLLSSAIGFASGDDQLELVHAWFLNGQISDTERKPIQGVEVSTKRKHQMVEKIFTSKKIPNEKKSEAF